MPSNNNNSRQFGSPKPFWTDWNTSCGDAHNHNNDVWHFDPPVHVTPKKCQFRTGTKTKKLKRGWGGFDRSGDTGGKLSKRGCGRNSSMSCSKNPSGDVGGSGWSGDTDGNDKRGCRRQPLKRGCELKKRHLQKMARKEKWVTKLTIRPSRLRMGNVVFPVSCWSVLLGQITTQSPFFSVSPQHYRTLKGQRFEIGLKLLAAYLPYNRKSCMVQAAIHITFQT